MAIQPIEGHQRYFIIIIIKKFHTILGYFYNDKLQQQQKYKNGSGSNR